nr:3'-5' exonuclease [uncultured Arsenicibacter sp.]
MYLFYDTETTGVPKSYKEPVTNTDNWPRITQLAWAICNAEGEITKTESRIIKPDGFTIPAKSTETHGITTEFAMEFGNDLTYVLHEFRRDMQACSYQVAHNIDFDKPVVSCECVRMLGQFPDFMLIPDICTMKGSKEFCQIPNPPKALKYGLFKSPRLEELYKYLFNETFDGAHDALNDILATVRCFWELRRLKVL